MIKCRLEGLLDRCPAVDDKVGVHVFMMPFCAISIQANHGSQITYENFSKHCYKN